MTEVLLPELVRRRCESDPERTALIDADGAVTYAGLETSVAQVAGALIARGLAGASIGVCVARGRWSIAAMLGIWRAGGVYVPLDPRLPPARLQLMAAEAGLRGLIADERNRPVAGAVGIDVVSVNEAVTPVTRVASRHRHDPAYVIFTSGSTGRPKATLVQHGPLTDHVRAAGDMFGITPRDRALAFASFGFDASLEQVLPALAAGAGVVIRPDELWSIRKLGTVVARHEITVMELTPTYWAEMVARLDRLGHLFASLRLLVTGGEALPSEPLSDWFEHLPDVPIVNTYGPTEAVISATAYVVRAPLTGRVPIGGPFGARRLHVLDEKGELVPPGAAGELAIGGAGLAVGYLGRPSATCGVSVPDGYGDVPGGRLYRTGDRVRRLPDGSLEFLGRSDSQVKIRGHRIELGEVESVLRGHSGVRGAHVTVCDTGGDRVLGACVAGRDLEPGEVVARCRKVLPDYMVPAILIVMDELPMTVQGKVDAAACVARLSARK
jgi:amino acid adenylation domain-containing protein